MKNCHADSSVTVKGKPLCELHFTEYCNTTRGSHELDSFIKMPDNEGLGQWIEKKKI